MGHYRETAYDNSYPSITRIANEFMMLRPYAVMAGNKRADNKPALDKIYHPNQQFSSVSFREALAIMAMVHPKVYLLVWRNEDGVSKAGGPFTEESISGYTFLEHVSETVIGGKRYYQSGPNRYTDDDLIIIPGFNPHDVTGGYSPSEAVRKWANVDDLIAEFEAGLFRNGGVPPGMLTITAKSTTDYKNIRQNIEEKHKGAGNNNKLMFNYRPLDDMGQAQEAQIVWTPFNVDNKTLDLGTLFENANKKIDSVFGVPASIRGVSDNNNYASARMDEIVFIRYVVKPFATKLWTTFTHELNRLTGGLGYAITFDIVVPSIAEEQKIDSEKKEIDARTLSSLVDSGYTLESSIEYIQTGDIAKLKMGEKIDPKKPEDNPDIDDGNEVENTPDQPLPNESNTKNVTVKRIQENDQQTYIDKLSNLTRQQTERQVEKALANLDATQKAYGDTTAEEDENFANAILAALVPLIVIYGQRQTDQGVDLLLNSGLVTDGIQSFQMSATQAAKYRKYLKMVARSYSDETGMIIRDILGKSVEAGMSEFEIKRQIRKVLLGADNEYRVRRLARTEVVSSEGRASVAAMDQIQRETGFKIYKVWNTGSSDPCPYCVSFKGKRKLVSENFIDLDEEVHADGGTLKNNFAARETATMHPNCGCYTTYEVEAE